MTGHAKPVWKWIDSSFVKWFKTYDANVLKPTFVRPGNESKSHNDDHFNKQNNSTQNVKI